MSAGRASRASSDAARSSSSARVHRVEERGARMGDAAAQHDPPDVVGHDQLVDRAGHVAPGCLHDPPRDRSPAVASR